MSGNYNILPFVIPVAVAGGVGSSVTESLFGYIKQIRLDGPVGGTATLDIVNPQGVKVYSRALRVGGNELTNVPVRGVHSVAISAASADGAWQVYLANETL